jgi:hypothetical protein
MSVNLRARARMVKMAAAFKSINRINQKLDCLLPIEVLLCFIHWAKTRCYFPMGSGVESSEEDW